MADQVLSSALQPGPECIDVERLGRYVDGAMDARERQIVKTHIDACATCQSEIALVQAFADTRVDDKESAAVRDIVAELNRRPSPASAARREESRARRIFSVGMRRALMTAAALLLVVGSVYLFRSPAPQLPADIDAGRDVTRSMRVAVSGPIGDQQTVPTRLEWQPIAGAARYHVRLMEVDRSELWSADANGPGIDLPDAVRARIVPAKTLLWDVTAYGSTNTVVAASDVQRFRLVP